MALLVHTGPGCGIVKTFHVTASVIPSARPRVTEYLTFVNRSTGPKTQRMSNMISHLYCIAQCVRTISN